MRYEEAYREYQYELDQNLGRVPLTSVTVYKEAEQEGCNEAHCARKKTPPQRTGKRCKPPLKKRVIQDLRPAQSRCRAEQIRKHNADNSPARKAFIPRPQLTEKHSQEKHTRREKDNDCRKTDYPESKAVACVEGLRYLKVKEASRRYSYNT